MSFVPGHKKVGHKARHGRKRPSKQHGGHRHSAGKAPGSWTRAKRVDYKRKVTDLAAPEAGEF